MTTTTQLPIQTVAQRSVLQKTFVEATLLAGFTDLSHFEQLCGEFLLSQDDNNANKRRDEANVARAYVSQLEVSDEQWLNDVVRNQISGEHIHRIISDPIFQQTFGSVHHQFAYVDLNRLVALQPWVEPRRDRVPKKEQELLNFALPTDWEVPAEISYLPQTNSIQVLSSDPALSGLQVDFDHVAGKVTLSPPKHPNLVQVTLFNGRAYLRNGYHRCVDALAQGINELPAIVVQAFTPDQVLLPGAGCFNLFHVMTLPRPPLVSDFLTPSATTTKVRERRYGVLIGFDVKPFNIGV